MSTQFQFWNGVCPICFVWNLKVFCVKDYGKLTLSYKWQGKEVSKKNRLNVFYADAFCGGCLHNGFLCHSKVNKQHPFVCSCTYCHLGKKNSQVIKNVFVQQCYPNLHLLGRV